MSADGVAVTETVSVIKGGEEGNPEPETHEALAHEPAPLNPWALAEERCAARGLSEPVSVSILEHLEYEGQPYYRCLVVLPRDAQHEVNLGRF